MAHGPRHLAVSCALPPLLSKCQLFLSVFLLFFPFCYLLGVYFGGLFWRRRPGPFKCWSLICISIYCFFVLFVCMPVWSVLSLLSLLSVLSVLSVCLVCMSCISCLAVSLSLSLSLPLSLYPPPSDEISGNSIFIHLTLGNIRSIRSRDWGAALPAHLFHYMLLCWIAWSHPCQAGAPPYHTSGHSHETSSLVQASALRPPFYIHMFGFYRFHNYFHSFAFRALLPSGIILLLL